jgi:hypothetical protein
MQLYTPNDLPPEKPDGVYPNDFNDGSFCLYRTQGRYLMLMIGRSMVCGLRDLAQFADTVVQYDPEVVAIINNKGWITIFTSVKSKLTQQRADYTLKPIWHLFDDADEDANAIEIKTTRMSIFDLSDAKYSEHVDGHRLEVLLGNEICNCLQCAQRFSSL